MYKKRIIIFLSIIVLASLAIAGRLWHLQFVQGDHWVEVAEKMLQDTDLLPARRGSIMDRNGNVLAMDKSCYELCLDYRFIVMDDANARKDEWLNRKINQWRSARLKEIRNSRHVDNAEARKIFAERQARTWQIVRNAAEAGGVDHGEAIDRIKRRIRAVRSLIKMPSHLETQPHMIVLLDEMPEEDMDETVGLALRPSRKRWYPYGHLACHIVGVTSQVNPSEQRRYNIPEGEASRLTRMLNNYLPGDSIGKIGAEKMCESLLRGKRGFIRYRRDRSRKQLLGQKAVDGEDVRLTLDIYLQAALMQKIEELNVKGCAVVIDVPTGEILALVSVPTFNLNAYKTNKNYYEQIISDRTNKPYLHRGISMLYWPGSSVKPITAIAGLSSGVITPSTVFNCRGYFRDPRANAFRCHKRSGHGPLDMYEAIKRSCNIYFEEIAELLGASRLSAYFSLFGIDRKPGTGLPNEEAGTLPTEEFVRRHYNRGFIPADHRFLAIGQDAIKVTPLHMANVMATIARDGEFFSPVIARDGGPEQVRQTLPLASQHLAAVRKGMYKVVNEYGGTAYRKIKTQRTTFCGKTGTAQTNITGSPMSWFVGFAPYNNPRVAFAVVVEYAATRDELQYKFKIMQTLMDACEELGYLP